MPRMPDWTDAPRSRATTPNVPRTPKDFVGEAAGRLGETIAREAEASEELNLRIAKQQRNEGRPSNMLPPRRTLQSAASTRRTATARRSTHVSTSGKANTPRT